MDPISSAIGLGIGIASIVSIFETCLHGYRTLTTAIAMGDAAVTLGIQFQIEESRLFLWGRNWGLVQVADRKLEIVHLSDDSESDSDSDDNDNTEGKPRAADKAPAPLDSVDEDWEIPGLRDLTIEILGRINKSLEEWKLIAARYGSAPSGKDDKARTDDATALKESSRELLANIASKQAGKTKEISNRNKFTSKLRWALKDKQELEELLTKLTSLNDSLEKLLPRRERTSLARGLAGEILVILESGDISMPDLDEQLGHLQGNDEVKAARIVLLRRSNKTETSERLTKAKKLETDTDPANGPTPFAKQSIWLKGTPGAMQIPVQDFVRLAEPKMKDHQVHRREGKWFSGRYAPMQRSLAVYSPLTAGLNTTGSTDTSRTAVEGPAQVALIEWRPAAHESSTTELTEKDLLDRRDHIARLLHRTFITDTDFRVLDCLGYTTAHGHSPDGSTHDLIGYVYRYPEFASQQSPPISLRDILGQAYASDDPKVPSLDTRFKLARSLSIALYQLQCAGWVHRKISSYNVVFFKDGVTKEVDLSHPFLTGWQYSRPDDERRGIPSEQGSEGVGDLDMYVHRKRLVYGGQEKFPRFRKSFDIYSLGIILMEIAFWEPIVSLTSEEERQKMDRNEDISSGERKNDWWRAISRTAREELAPEMGVAYRNAVLFCLQGLDNGPKKDFETLREEERRSRSDGYFVDEDFQEVGIEKEFYWRVLKPLERFNI
ncbi:hypothetical protein L207DRAFT_519377 [Hyaloscypha variabilis F]|uniref:Uncharacterized protein n=1 Tax=Hyaloscypha variabilis (strain UAMH 11265 / GT02V1 / F) TaxID=1149755 RepID=A0A2J6QZF2_HYAVF|nr:hypothetical protein L207DRAFT_519377 [Hyaloscypha variabilis F]